MMARYNATALCCTPTYALRLGESIGAPSGVNLDQLSVKRIIVAGEPGGSLPTTRERIRQLWGGAKLFDHHGMSEVGPVSYEDPEMPASLCVIEDSYFAEVVDSAGNEVPDGSEANSSSQPSTAVPVRCSATARATGSARRSSMTGSTLKAAS
ncbi:hypothetical protein [Verrucomicrobium spinosum]|uniref:hypothetical protein n=1 Tax=Verrucomicrobium spinosum TaxID=2736 RepID=UPI000B22154C|nr:hypothetical protein [Verrucomicrobium spinosum]